MPPGNIGWRQFGKYSGPYVSATTNCYRLPDNSKHLDRAFWLTTCVESSKGPNPRDGGKFGTWNAYDGCGGTGGLHQGIAVYPAEISDPDHNMEDDQGGLFEMIRQIDLATDIKSTDVLREAYRVRGWYLADDGKLRELSAHKAVSGKEIRNEFTPPDGRVPESGPQWEQAARWSKLHHAVFADPVGYKSQIGSGLNYLTRFCKAKRPKLGGLSVNEAVYETSVIEAHGWFTTMSAHDLAMCMFLSHAVNAPGIALQKLDAALKAVNSKSQSEDFPRLLIKALDCHYGRWDDDIPGGRYQRTRTAAMGVWPKELFTGDSAVMPKNLPD